MIKTASSINKGDLNKAGKGKVKAGGIDFWKY